jgi:hypothetical protein
MILTTQVPVLTVYGFLDWGALWVVMNVCPSWTLTQPLTMKKLAKLEKLFQLPQPKNVVPQLRVVAPPLGGFGPIAEAVSAFLTTQTNLAKSNDLFELVQAKNIMVQLRSRNACRLVSFTQAFTRPRRHRARRAWASSSQANAANAGEFAEHKVATFGFEELVLRFVQQPVEGIAVWESP